MFCMPCSVASWPVVGTFFAGTLADFRAETTALPNPSFAVTTALMSLCAVNCCWKMVSACWLFQLGTACSPTFVSVSPDDRRLYVACNHSNALMVLDAGTLELVKQVETGHGAYNVEPSGDGRWVIVTNKKDQSISLIDAASLRMAQIITAKVAQLTALEIL